MAPNPEERARQTIDAFIQLGIQRFDEPLTPAHECVGLTTSEAGLRREVTGSGTRSQRDARAKKYAQTASLIGPLCTAFAEVA